jgi:hypothetical protein
MDWLEKFELSDGWLEGDFTELNKLVKVLLLELGGMNC